MLPQFSLSSFSLVESLGEESPGGGGEVRAAGPGQRGRVSRAKCVFVSCLYLHAELTAAFSP